jgi:hypothetical protein
MLKTISEQFINKWLHQDSKKNNIGIKFDWELLINICIGIIKLG